MGLVSINTMTIMINHAWCSGIYSMTICCQYPGADSQWHPWRLSSSAPQPLASGCDNLGALICSNLDGNKINFG